MKIAHNIFNSCIESKEKVICLVIENQHLFTQFLTEIKNEMQGNFGRIVISEENVEINFQKQVELISDFICFDICKKGLLNKIYSEIENKLKSEKYINETMNLLAQIEIFINKIALELPGNIYTDQIAISNFVKSASVFIQTVNNSLPMQLLDYMELVNEYETNKIFVLVNFRDYISDDDFDLFLQTAISHGYRMLLIESHERRRSQNELRVVIDKDLCEIRS